MTSLGKCARPCRQITPKIYRGDIATFFFFKEKDALFSWSEEHNDFTNLVKFTDTVKLSLFENEILESAHNKAVDVIKTLIKIIKRAEQLGMDKEQVAEVPGVPKKVSHVFKVFVRFSTHPDILQLYNTRFALVSSVKKSRFKNPYYAC